MQLQLQFSIQPARMFVPDKAPLTRVADWLTAGAQAHERVIDLQAQTLVLPTARAGRRLLELLVDRAEQKQRGLLPPRIFTTGGLVGLLAHPYGESAPQAMVQLAWWSALRAEPSACKSAFGVEGSALELAAMCERMDRELMSAGHTFSALPGERYAALETLRLLCVSLLSQWGYVDPRRLLVEGSLPPGRLVLVGVVDLPLALRRKLSAQDTTIVCLAPEHWRERFDAWGSLVKARWVAATLELDDAMLYTGASAREQADGAVRWLATLGERSTREVSVAVADEEVMAPMEHALAAAGAPAHVALPLPFVAQPVARLLQAAADFLERPMIDPLATFARHPDTALVDLLRAFDRYRQAHLPETLVLVGDDRDAVLARELVERVLALLGDLQGAPRPLSEWCGEILAFLARVYGTRKLSASVPDDRCLLDALDAILRACQALQRAESPMGGAEALRFVLSVCQDEAIARQAQSDAVELFGWLELPLDDAPVTIVCGCNEGKLPSAVNADAFLPNSVRLQLGLVDNEQRYARDAYVLSVLLRTRERLLLTMGRRSLLGDPLLPSRLVLACDGRVAAQRIERFFAEKRLPTLPGHTGVSLSVPEPDATDSAPHQLPVTAFAEYLACPYRFYLKRVLKLRGVDDSAREMSPALTGNLLHGALHAFGTGAHAAESEAHHIGAAMRDALWSATRRMFGNKPPLAVRAQVGQLEQRLPALAAWQARWFAEGWRIAHCELAFKGEMAPFEVDGQPVFLTGTLDRVDVHPELGVAILDYKTSDNALRPEEKHLRDGQWVDLQLPLYRELWRTLGDVRPVRLGYVNIGKTERETRGHVARWTDADLQPAYEVARNIVRQVRQRVFWPMSEKVAYDDWEWICQ